MTSAMLIAAGIAVAAGLMRGFAGVGSGMLMAPIFAVLFGPVETVGIIILMEIVVTGQLLPDVHRDIDWRVIAPMGLAAALLMPVGSWVLVSLDADLNARGIAGIVLAFALVLLWCSESLHGLDNATVALLGALAVTAPRIGALTFKQAVKGVDWNLLVFMAACLQLGDALVHSGGAAWAIEALFDGAAGGARRAARPLAHLGAAGPCLQPHGGLVLRCDGVRPGLRRTPLKRAGRYSAPASLSTPPCRRRPATNARSLGTRLSRPLGRNSMVATRMAP